MPQGRQIIKDVPAEDIGFWTSLLRADGYTVVVEQQDDGTTALIGTDSAPVGPDAGSGAGAGDARRIAWGKKVSSDFKTRLFRCCERLQANPDYLMAAMAFETGCTFSPKALNAKSKATGLIQFMPKTAQSLGTTTDLLSRMTAEDQLVFVEQYLTPYRGRMETIEDTYMAILFPIAIGKPNDYVLFAQGSRAYEQNRGLDRNQDGKVTKAEAAAMVRARLEQGLSPPNIG
jgi:Transglycosylase SLT domain